MADVAKRMTGTADLTGSNVSLYTAPATGAVIRNIHAANHTTADATFTLALDGTSATAANCFLYQVTVPALGTYDWSGFQVLGNVGTIQALASAATTITLTVSGIEL